MPDACGSISVYTYKERLSYYALLFIYASEVTILNNRIFSILMAKQYLWISLMVGILHKPLNLISKSEFLHTEKYLIRLKILKLLNYMVYILIRFDLTGIDVGDEVSV